MNQPHPMPPADTRRLAATVDEILHLAGVALPVSAGARLKEARHEIEVPNVAPTSTGALSLLAVRSAMAAATMARFEMHLLQLPVERFEQGAVRFEERLGELKHAADETIAWFGDAVSRGDARIVDGSARFERTTVAAGLVRDLRLEARSNAQLSPVDLALELARWITATVGTHGDALAVEETRRVRDGLERMSQRCAERMGDVVAAIAMAAAEAFQTPPSTAPPFAAGRATATISRRMGVAVTPVVTVLPAARLIPKMARRAPRRWARRLILRRAEGELLERHNQMIGRVEVEIDRSAAEIVRHYDRALVSTFEDEAEAIRSAIARVQSLRCGPTEKSTQMRALLEVLGRRAGRLEELAATLELLHLEVP